MKKRKAIRLNRAERSEESQIERKKQTGEIERESLERFARWQTRVFLVFLFGKPAVRCYF